MAELLIRQFDNHRPQKDDVATRLGYRTGDVVTVQPDGHPWSPRECDTARFRVLKLPGVPVADLRVYTEPETVADLEDGDYDLYGAELQRPVRRRLYCFDEALLPTVFQRDLALGHAVVDHTAFLKAMTHKTDRHRTEYQRGRRGW